MADWVMPLFTIVVAVALLVETLAVAAVFMGVVRLLRRIDRATESVQGRLYPVLSHIQSRLDEVQPRVSYAIVEAGELTRSARAQAERADRKITEWSDEFSSKLARLDQKVTARLDAVEVTGSRIRHAVLAPFQSMKALSKGIQTGIDVYRRRSRKPDGWARSPEERIAPYSAEAEDPRINPLQ